MVKGRVGMGAERPALPGTVEPRLLAIAAERLADPRLMHEARGRLAIAQDAEQAAPSRQPGHEGSGAIDGVDDPAPRGAAVTLAELLADDAVVWMARRDALADVGFHGPVRVRHRIEAVIAELVPNRQGLPETRRCKLAGGRERLLAERQQTVDFGHGSCPGCAGVAKWPNVGGSTRPAYHRATGAPSLAGKRQPCRGALGIECRRSGGRLGADALATLGAPRG